MLRRHRLFNSTYVCWLFICAGVALRTFAYVSNRSLWLDEAKLALNIINRTLPQLVKPMGHFQGASIGFLAVEKAAVKLFGNNEYALRLFPFLCGIAGLFLFYRIARHFLQGNAVPIAVGLFALSQSLVYFSAEAKQYSTDVFLTLAMYTAASYLQSGRLNARRLILFGLTGALAIWFSHPVLFVMAGIGLTVTVSCAARKDWASALRTFFVYLFWLASFVACYVLTWGLVRNARAGFDSWPELFAPFPPTPHWLHATFFGIFIDPVGIEFRGIAALTCIVGGVLIARKKQGHLALLLLPAFFAYVASAAKLYPTGWGRYILFMTPALLLLIAEGAEYVRARTWKEIPAVGIVLFVLLFWFPTGRAAELVIKGSAREEMKPVVQYISAHKESGDTFYVYLAAIPAFQYYAPKYGMVDIEYHEGDLFRARPAQYAEALNRFRGNKRVWIILSHLSNEDVKKDEWFFLYYLDSIGKRLDAVKAKGSAAYLYDLSIGMPGGH